MEIIFSTPMRLNNNTRYESGDRRLGDIIDFALFNKVSVEVNIETMESPNTVLIQYSLSNGGVEVYRQDDLMLEPKRYYYSVMNPAITENTILNGIIHTNGRSRYQVKIAAFEPGEFWPDDPFQD
jgi:hypothetical protein